jgi:hypothetical protein
MAKISQDPLDSSDNTEKHHLLKITGKAELGSRDSDGSVKEFFDTQDIGVLQSTTLLQPFPSTEFKSGETGPNAEWVAKIKLGTLALQQANVGTATWATSGSDAEIELAAFKAIKDRLENPVKNVTKKWLASANLLKTFFLPANTLYDSSSTWSGATWIAHLQTLIDNSTSYVTKVISESYNFTDLNAATVHDLLENLLSPNPAEREGIFQSFGSLSKSKAYGDYLIDNVVGVMGPIFEGDTVSKFKKETNTPHLISGIRQNYYLLTNTPFTGLSDTPNGYVSGQFLRSTASGIEFFSLGDGGLVDFSGLSDTPTGYQSGKFLRSTASGIEFFDLGQGGQIAFSGLSDTPTGYQSGKFLISDTGDISFGDVNFLENVADRPTTELISGFLALDKNSNLVW